ncbi:MAG: glycosyltransferase family 2 protein [Calditrichaeota bacterium]|nr:MAG: glycosyltransferase family 2 protein [Calditrichota bacterium]
MNPQNTAPLVYCLVLNLNGNEVIDEALDSILKMDYANFRVLVVDNGSTDGSLERVKSGYSEIEVIELSENLGFGGGNNVGMQHALKNGAEWVFLLNNDIVVHENLLTELMNVGISSTSIGVLGAKIYYHDEPDKIWFGGGGVNFFTGVAYHRNLRKIDRGQFEEIRESDYITGCAFLVRATVLEKVGLFDDAFFPSYVEDADLSLRIRNAGYKLMYVPRGKLWHKVSSYSGGGLTPLKTRLKTAHSLLFFSRYAQWYHWLTMPLFILAGTLVFVVREAVKGNWGVVKALFAGFAEGMQKYHRLRRTAD